MNPRRFPLFLLCSVAAFFAAGCSKETRTARSVAKGDQQFAAGHYDEAELEYLNALQANSLSPRAIAQLGIIYFEQGRYGRVMAFLNKSAELTPDNLEIRRERGRMYLVYGNNAGARDEALFILGKDPTNADAPILLAESATTEKEAAEARKRIQELPTAGTAPALVGLATLDLLSRNMKDAEVSLRRAEAADAKLDAVYSAWTIYYTLQKDEAGADAAFQKAAELSGPRSIRKIAYAQHRVQVGDLDGAEKILDGVIAQTPDYLPALVNRGQLEIARRNFAGAEPYVAKIFARDNLHPEALYLDIQAKLGKNEPAKAVLAAEKALKTYPNSPQLHYGAALGYYGLMDTGKAAAALKEALVFSPKFLEASLLLAEINIRRGDPNAAVVALRPVLRDRPDLVQGWLLLAGALRKQDDLEGAANAYRQLAQLSPRQADPYVLLGGVLEQQGKIAEARQQFEKALEVSPQFVPPIEELVALDIRERKLDDARGRIEQRVANRTVTPNDQARLQILLARVEIAANRIPQAEVAFLRAIQLAPESSDGYLSLAQLYITTKRDDEALASLEKVVAKDGRNSQAWMLRGTIQEQKKDFKGAVDSYDKVIAVNPRSAPALNNLAWINSEFLGQADKGLEFAKRAREAEPNDPRIADTLGWALYRKGQYAEAQALLQQAAQAMPDEGAVQYHLGMAHYMLGAEAAARTALQRAINSKSDFDEREDARQRLAALALNPASGNTGNLVALEKMAADRKDDPVVLMRLADAYARTGAPEKALRAYQSALTISPNNAKATLELARLYSAANESGKALELAKSARNLAPDDPDAAHQLGRVAFESGNFSWSLSLLQEAQRDRPNDPDLLFDLARAYYANGNVAEAEGAMRRVTSGSHATEARQFLEFTNSSALPVDARIQQVLGATRNFVPALMAQAIQSERKGDATAAIRNYEAVLKQYPDFVPAKRNLAILYAQDPANDQKTFELALKARETFLGDADLSKAYGTVLYRRKEYTRAIPILGDVLAARPNDAESLFYLGMSQEKANHTSEAKQTLQKALAAGLKPELAAEATKALK